MIPSARKPFLWSRSAILNHGVRFTLCKVPYLSPSFTPSHNERPCTNFVLYPLLSGFESGEQYRWTNAAMPVPGLAGEISSCYSRSLVVSFSNIPTTHPWLNTYCVRSTTVNWSPPTICMWRILVFILLVSRRVLHLREMSTLYSE